MGFYALDHTVHYVVQYSPVNSHTKNAEILCELSEPIFTSTLSMVSSYIQDNRANYLGGAN